MSTHTLRPWTDLVKLHPDVEAGALTEAVFAIDLGAIAANDPNVPVVNRDPEAFFRATYLTADLQRLLEEILASLASKSGYNRVLKLRTPFGGGKSHTLDIDGPNARANESMREWRGRRQPSPV
jgi:predicted AAA+ superfamily ATPase